MNPERLDHLLTQYFENEVTHEEIGELDVALQTQPEVRERFWREAHVQGALREWGLERRGEREIRALQSVAAPPFPQRERFRWLGWRPLTAAAGGVVLGLLCASMGWAVTAPRNAALLSRPVPLKDGSFETRAGRVASGFPSEYGVWSGDEVRAVEAPGGRAIDGKRLLQFVHANREPALPNYGAHSCDVFQLIDLRPFKAESDSREATLELSVQFLDCRAIPGDRITFLCRLHVFTGSPETLMPEWPLNQQQALALGSASAESTGGTPDKSHRVSTKILLPPRADFALVHLIAHKPKNPAGTEAEFDAQYADDVRLTLQCKTAPLTHTIRR
jgi:hypothetical protein